MQQPKAGPPRPSKWYRSPAFWIGMFISVPSIVLLFSLIDLHGLLDKLSHADLRFVLLAMACTAASCFFRAVRWQAILGREISFRNIFHTENISYLLNSLLPLRVGEAARIVMICRSKNQRAITPLEALSTVVLCRVLDTLIVVVLLGLVLPALDVPEVVKAGGYTMLTLGLVAVVVLLLGAFARPWLIRLATAILKRLLPEALTTRLINWLDNFLSGLVVLRNPRRLFAVVAWTGGVSPGFLCIFSSDFCGGSPSPPHCTRGPVEHFPPLNLFRAHLS